MKLIMNIAKHLMLIPSPLFLFLLSYRYGPGPYKVEFTVIFNGERKYFAVETAPNNLMPHAVYTFMQLVESGTMIGKEFTFSSDQPGRVMTADNIELVSSKNDNNKIKTKDLLYPEYNDNYPHKQGTLGFSGINGSNFYINIVDNREDIHHGGLTEDQKLMYHHTIDPCFANVVHGIDIVDLIVQRIHQKDLHCVIQNVEIVQN